MFSLHGVFLEKFPLAYFHLLVLHLRIGHSIFTLQDFKIIKPKPFAAFKTEFILLLLLLFSVKYWHAGSLF